MQISVNDFEVESKLWGGFYRCRFKRIASAIATRQSDTLDCFFQVDDRMVTVAISLPGLAEFKRRTGKGLDDQQTVDLAALSLRRALERGESVSAPLMVGTQTLIELAGELAFH